MESNLPYICFAISIFLSAWHLIEEFRGKLWRYFGAIAGVPIPDTLGKIIFTGALGLTLFTAALGILEINGGAEKEWLSLSGIGFLIGGRISDWWYSHYRLKSKGYENNPGLLSAWFYLADAALLIYLGVRKKISYAR